MDIQIKAYIQNEWDSDDGSNLLDDSFNDQDFVVIVTMMAQQGKKAHWRKKVHWMKNFHFVN